MATLNERVIANAKARGVKILTRAEWGSKPSGVPWPLAPDVPNVYEWRRANKPVRVLEADTLVRHISVTPDTGPLIGDFRTDMRTVERIGFDRFGSGFSYNWGIDPTTGMVGEGMPLDAKGTHTVNDKNVSGYSYDQNHAARAIATLAMPGVKLTKEAEWAESQLIAAMIEEGALTDSPDFVPHSLFAAKTCPTANITERMDEIMAAALAAIPTEPKPTTLSVVHASGRFDERITASSFEQWRANSSVQTHTEATDGKGANEVNRLGQLRDQYGARVVGTGKDGAITWNRRWVKVTEAIHRLPDALRAKVRGTLHRELTMAQLRRRWWPEGQVVTFAVAHLQAFAQDDLIAGRTTPQTKRWHEQVDEIMSVLAQVPGPVVFNADWNLDYLHAKGKAIIDEKAAMAGLTVVVPDPKAGSKGRKLIDLSLVRGVNIIGGEVLPATASSDHKPIVARLNKEEA